MILLMATLAGRLEAPRQLFLFCVSVGEPLRDPYRVITHRLKFSPGISTRRLKISLVWDTP